MVAPVALDSFFSPVTLVTPIALVTPVAFFFLPQSPMMLLLPLVTMVTTDAFAASVATVAL